MLLSLQAELTNKEGAMATEEVCEMCHGTRAVDGKPHRCDVCEGRRVTPNGFSCVACRGIGEVPNLQTCPACIGSGSVSARPPDLEKLKSWWVVRCYQRPDDCLYVYECVIGWVEGNTFQRNGCTGCAMGRHRRACLAIS
jgi:RecJ-like exonuclease